MPGDYGRYPDLAQLHSALQLYYAHSGTKIHEWMSEQEERQRSVTTNVPLGQNSQKGTERLLPPETHEHGDDLSRLESTATEAELQHLAAAEAMAGGADPRDTLSAMAKFDFGGDGHLTVETLAEMVLQRW